MKKIIKYLKIITGVIAYTVYYSLKVVLFIYFSRNKYYFQIQAKLWAKALLRVFNVKVNAIYNVSPTQTDSYIYIANHASYLDIPVILATAPANVVFVAKKSLFYVPFLGWAMKAGGTIFIDRKNPAKAYQSLFEGAEMLKKGYSTIIFPEGTRTPDGTLKPFKKGAFRLAKYSNIPILVLALKGTYDILPRSKLLPKVDPPLEVSIIYYTVMNPQDYSDYSEMLADGYNKVKEALSKLT